MTPPDADDYEHDHQSEELTELHTHVEGDEILQQSVLGQIEFLYLGRQSEPVKEAEDENGGLRVGLKAKESLKASQVVKAFVDNREADDRVDQVRVDSNIEENSEHQSETVPEGEQRDVDQNVFRTIEKEDHTHQKEDMIVARDHVLGSDVEERDDRDPLVAEQELLCVLIDSVSGGRDRRHQTEETDYQRGDYSWHQMSSIEPLKFAPR